MDEQVDEMAASGAFRPVSGPTHAGRRLRLLELLLVSVVAFGGALIESVGFVFTGENFSGYREAGGVVRTIYGVVNQVSVLALLVYVLFRQGRSLTVIGLSFSWWNEPRSLGLGLAAAVCTATAEYGLYYTAYFLTGHAPTAHLHNLGFLLASPSPWSALWLLLYVLINPWVEELLARACVMSEVRFLTGR